MPQPFNNAVITNNGARLLTRAQAGEIKIEITRIVVGNGDYTEDEKMLSALQEQTNLKSPKNSYTISNLEVYSDYSVKVTALITNLDPVTGETLVNTGYFINEMGLFAKEKDGASDTEILYSIAVTSGGNGDFMPPYNGYNPAQIIQDYFATVNNSAEVYIKTTGAAALAEDVISIKKDVDRLKQNGVADRYCADNEYHVGDYCLYEDVLYKCLIDTTGEWNPEYWKKTSPMGELANIKKEIADQITIIESLTKILGVAQDGNVDWMMQGATETAAGKAGMVPVPDAGMQDAVLQGSGLWGQLGAAAYYNVVKNLTTAEENKFLLGAEVGPIINEKITNLEEKYGELNSALTLKAPDYKNPIATISGANKTYVATEACWAHYVISNLDAVNAAIIIYIDNTVAARVQSEAKNTYISGLLPLAKGQTLKTREGSGSYAVTIYPI